MRRQKKQRAGAPAWMATFADLSILLMCFFVLLLSFSEMDALRYKQVMGSMRDAFGVQREVFAKDNPIGSTFIADQFSPGRPEPSPVQLIQQQTADSQRMFLKVRREGGPDADTESADDGFPRTAYVPGAPDAAQLGASAADAAKLQVILREEIEQGLLEVVREGETITIRIRERGAFPSGEATLLRPFTPVIQKIAEALGTISGDLVVAGHTDSLPINTPRFRSNWELSAARAVTVVHHILAEGRIAPARLIIEGHADTRPLVANDTRSNRALNRRVEIVIRQGIDTGRYKSANELSQATDEGTSGGTAE
jgi:chemotaxis protein MotB